MAYLNCPTCRLTIYTPIVSFEECPRCRARLGRVSRLFRSPLPPRLLRSTRDSAETRRGSGGPRPGER